MGHEIARAELQVIVASDAQSAELSIPHNLGAEQFTVEALIAALKTADVEITDAVVRRLEELVAAPPASDQPHRVVVAEATPPVHGTDGYVEWLVKEDHRPPQDVEGAIDFYALSAYTLVTQGQTIGRLVPPTDGREGRDVLGKPIAAKNGQAAELKLDETIVLNESSELVAQIAGVFVRKGARPTIHELLEVPDYVDFSTGNINFDGNVSVRKGVRDMFRVEATGRIEIRGLVEAAIIDCQGDIVLAGGMAGREHGRVIAAGNVIARHLSGTRLDVKGDLQVDKEMMGCHATVGGRVLCPQGAIIGGTLKCAREIIVATVGSPAGAETTIELESLSLLRARTRRLEETIEQLGHVLQNLVREHESLKARGSRLPPRSVTRLKTLTDEIRKANEELKIAVTQRDQTASLISALIAFNATVSKCLHVGTVFAIGRRLQRVYMDVLGPLKLTIAESGQVLVHTEGAAAIPLEKITRPISAAA